MFANVEANKSGGITGYKVNGEKSAVKHMPKIYFAAV
jgi:hypothetical protein